MPRRLTADRLARLDALGFDWVVTAGPKASWEARFAELAAYRRAHGRFPSQSEGRLGGCECRPRRRRVARTVVAVLRRLELGGLTNHACRDVLRQVVQLNHPMCVFDERRQCTHQKEGRFMQSLVSIKELLSFVLYFYVP